MPAQQQVLENLVCVLCDSIISEEQTNPSLHDDCINEEVRECMECGTIGISSGTWYGMSQNQRNVIRTIGYDCIDFVYAEDTNETICENCAYACTECSRTFQYEDSMYECCGTGDRLNSYSYRPAWRFWFTDDANEVKHSYGPNSDTLYMGIELEMTGIANCVLEFMEMCDEDNSDPNFFFLKEDGSVGYNGGELVTMPATLAAFQQLFPFKQLDEARKAFRLRSYAYESCGFHIHVNRSAFSPSHLWKFVTFQLKNPRLCQYVGQRDNSSYATWQYERNETRDIPEFVKGKKVNGRRYLAINFQNRHTVELRYFKGNLLKGSIMKNLEFVHSLYEYTKHMDYQHVLSGGLKEESYKNWLAAKSEYENLKTFLELGQTRSED